MRKRFGADLASALSFYTKALSKESVESLTLRCANMAFPPPAKLQPHEVVKGKKRAHVTPMRGLNVKGIWWCCYCMKLRRFVERDRHGERVHCCPLCDISHKDGMIARHNPIVWEKIEVRKS